MKKKPRQSYIDIVTMRRKKKGMPIALSGMIYGMTNTEVKRSRMKLDPETGLNEKKEKVCSPWCTYLKSVRKRISKTNYSTYCTGETKCILERKPSNCHKAIVETIYMEEVSDA